jgi:ribonuclease P protein component
MALNPAGMALMRDQDRERGELFRQDERLRKVERLRQRAQFLRAQRVGKRRSSQRLVIYAAPNGLTWARLGVTVSKKVGKAPRRARWKRLIREVFRRNKDTFAPGYDFVVIVKKQQLPTDRDDVFTEIAPHARKVVEQIERQGSR